jgi:hypothetical protein
MLYFLSRFNPKNSIALFALKKSQILRYCIHVVSLADTVSIPNFTTVVNSFSLLHFGGNPFITPPVGAQEILTDG